MIYRGLVKDGVVVLDQQVSLPDGTEVEVQPVTKPTVQAATESLYDRLKPFIGSAKGLPADASQRVEESLYGHDTP